MDTDDIKKNEIDENTLEIFSLEAFDEPKKKRPKSKRKTILVVLFLLIVVLSLSTVSYAKFQIDNGALIEKKEDKSNDEEPNFFEYVLDKIKSIFNGD